MGTMRADRLLSLLLLLQNRGRLTAPELAAELEVSVRTVYRDVEALAATGVPVYAERGPAGGYRLLDGYRTRLTGLTDAEADSLFLAGMPGPASELGLGAELAAAQLKLRAALPAELGARAARVAERFHLDAPGWFRETESVPRLATVAQGVWDQRVLAVEYRGWRRSGERELCPLGLVLKGGIWYLLATRGAPDDEARTYRVSRLDTVRLSAATFERPAGFDLGAHWAASTRRLAEARFRQRATLRISPRGAKLLTMFFGAAGAEALNGAEPSTPEGWLRVELPVETEVIAVGDLLRLGVEAEVLAPASLRAAVAETVRGLAHRYAVPEGAQPTTEEGEPDASPAPGDSERLAGK
ncbi:helix-turn-helix transcriptional regulator [Streptomyces profundus]|uniref:helix-turn-helix transcriptional regulator n=1 Tax=Streptomyces profundus TaxID=2867410 RepID=UPI001D16702D|nr:WYL domain-containing protein [Streptomyces sp. MA3_2.13]UED87162.1 WYL domain-containing protein [Streptomyces sp. MA3_2.13]